MNEPAIGTDLGQELAAVAIAASERPLWLFDFEQLRIVWANRAALELWRAESSAELYERDLVENAPALGRLEDYRELFRAQGSVEELWTLFPRSEPVSLLCRVKVVALPGGALATLVEASRLDREQACVQELRGAQMLLHASTMISLLDIDGEVITQNRAAQEAFGALGPVGHNPFVARCCDEEVGRRVLAQLHSEQSFCLDIEVQTVRGVRWHSLCGRRAIDPATGAVAVVVDERDVTKRKRTEDALRAGETRFRLLSMQAPVGIFLTNERGKCTFVNERWCAMSGHTAQDALAGGWQGIVHPDDAQRIATEWREMALARRDCRLQYRYLTPAGADVWVICHAVPVHDSLGSFTGYLGIIQDVTQSVLSQQRFSLLFEHSSDAHMMLDEAGAIVDCNVGAATLFEQSSREQLIGKSPALFSPERQPDGRSSRDKAGEAFGIAAREGMNRFDWLVLLPSGREFLAEISLTSATIDGKMMFFATSHDASERKRAEDAIVRSREAALEASRGKSRFLANMSHEIRTPMNGVLGMLQLVLGSELSQEQREFLGAAHASAEGLLEIINDILDLSKIEAGKLDIDSVELSVHELLHGSLQTAALRAHAKGIELIAELAPDVPSRLLGDPVRLRQVLTNLLVNAVKFTEVGHVMLSLSVTFDGANPLLTCCVADSGIGIAPDHLARVFHAFQQADGSTTRRFGGTGLGLTISRELITSMGGQLSAESSEGLGSRFRFTIPLHAAPAPASASIPHSMAWLNSEAAARRRILVVDDHPMARAVMICELEKQGAHVLSAATAAQACSVVSRDAQPIEAAFIDHALGKEVGLELARLLRRYPACRGTRFILLRSQDRIGRAALAGAGFEFALDKPVLPDDLRCALSAPQAASPTTSRYSLPTRASRAQRKLPSLRVLMVEDHPVNAHFLGTLLQRQGHRVVHAWNGTRALAALAEGVFDLVLMDVQMPEMDGLEATRRIRQLERNSGRRMPIVALTANAMKGDEDECLAAGMDYYLSKPIAAELLQAMIERITFHEVGPVETEQNAMLPVVLPIVLPAVPGGPPFSREDLLQRAAGDPRFMSELMQMFLMTHAEMQREVEESVASGDCQAVRNAAHRLKGALELVCAEPAAGVARSLELAAREQRPEAFSTLNQQLLRELQRLRMAMGHGSGHSVANTE